MNLCSLKLYIESLEPESNINLLIRIEKKILTRLLIDLSRTEPEQRRKVYSDFWNNYYLLPHGLQQGIGVNEIRNRAFSKLEIVKARLDQITTFEEYLETLDPALKTLVLKKMEQSKRIMKNALRRSDRAEKRRKKINELGAIG